MKREDLEKLFSMAQELPMLSPGKLVRLVELNAEYATAISQDIPYQEAVSLLPAGSTVQVREVKKENRICVLKPCKPKARFINIPKINTH